MTQPHPPIPPGPGDRHQPGPPQQPTAQYPPAQDPALQHPPPDHPPHEHYVRGLPPSPNRLVPAQLHHPPGRPSKPRPFSLSLSIGMTLVASVEWIFALLFLWLFMVVGVSALDSQDLGDAGLYRIMSSWTRSLADGLAVPLLILPLAAILMALLVLYRKPAMRLMYTALGVVTVGWSIWWLHDGAWWLFVVAHVGLSLALVWLPRVTAWYDDAQPPDPAPF